MGELAFRLIRSAGEDCNSRSHPAVNEIGGFKWSSSFGFARNDDNISAPDAVIDNEHPSSALGIECRIAGTAMLNAPTVQVGSNTVRSCGTGVEAAAIVSRTVSINTIVGYGTSATGFGFLCLLNRTGSTVSGNQIFNTAIGAGMKTSGETGSIVFENNDISGTAFAVYPPAE